MQNGVKIENIEEMRQLVGIDDDALRQAIRVLKAGDSVKLTLSAQPGSSETLPVRITSIKGSVLRGRLTGKPTSAVRSKLKQGALLVFTPAHIHSIPKDPQR